MWISSCQWYRFPTAALSASGIRVEGESFLSACQNKLPCIFCCQNKTGATFCGRSCKKSLHDDFLRRHYPHQVKGRSWMTSSQPAHTSSPVFISSLLYMFSFKIASGIYLFAFCFYESCNRIVRKGNPLQICVSHVKLCDSHV